MNSIEPEAINRIFKRRMRNLSKSDWLDIREICGYVVVFSVTTLIYFLPFYLLERGDPDSLIAGPENLRSLHSTLATAEASVLAIALSVTLVAIQVVSNKYSSRLPQIFLKEPLFRITFGTLAVGIGVNGVAIFFAGSLTTILASILVGVGFSLATIGFYALYQLIRRMIQLGSPEELIPAIGEYECDAEDIHKAYADEAAEPAIHPTHPLYNVILRGFELREYETSRRGIIELREVLLAEIGLLQTIEDTETGSELAGEIFETPMKEYFNSILLEAFENHQELIGVTTTAYERIARNAIHAGYDNIAEDAARGLTDAMKEAPDTWEGGSLRSPISDTFLNLLEIAAGAARFGAFRTMLIQFHIGIERFVRRRPDHHDVDQAIHRYYGSTGEDIFEQLVGRYGKGVSEPIERWIEPYPKSERKISPESEHLRVFWMQWGSLTETLIHYRQSTGQNAIQGPSVVGSWSGFVEIADEHEIPGLATLFCISMIKSAYAMTLLEGGSLPALTDNTLANLQLDCTGTPVDDAFEALLDESTPNRGRVPTNSTLYERDTESESNGLIGIFSSDDEGPPEFEGWCRALQQQVAERAEYLRERRTDST